METTVLASGLGFTEGPVIRQTGNTGEVVVTSISEGRVFALDGQGGARELADTAGGPNGATEGADGTIFVALVGRMTGSRVAQGLPVTKRPALGGGIRMIRPGGALEWLTLDPVSPNDLCFGPDGLLYATDPTRNDKRNDGRLWRVDPASGDAELLTSLDWYPNGIGFGLEADAVYVASTGNGRLMRFPFSSAGLGRPEVAIELPYGAPDGFAWDADGNLILCAVGVGPDDHGEVQVYGRDGHLQERLRPGPHRHYTNVAIGPDGRLILTDSTGGNVLTGSWPQPGLPLHPFRP
ncbi:MAG: SMP-30/gluconolactonase/LRE family protein [Candidatus Dormibacteraeota bacterium]|nr:SMP-30/gluconolactonase/LRE family protein [Candidatus Dormibacteraeota bacterium]